MINKNFKKNNSVSYEKKVKIIKNSKFTQNFFIKNIVSNHSQDIPRCMLIFKPVAINTVQALRILTNVTRCNRVVTYLCKDF